MILKMREKNISIEYFYLIIGIEAMKNNDFLRLIRLFIRQTFAYGNSKQNDTK